MKTYVRRTVEERLDATMKQIAKLETFHVKQYGKIAKLRERAQKLQNQIDAKAVVPVIPQ